MNDFDVTEQRVRRTLQAVAERSPVASEDETPWSGIPAPRSHGPGRLLAGAVAAVVIVAGFAVAVAYGPRSSDTAGSAKGDSTASTGNIRWSPARSVAKSFGLTQVACTSASFCLGLGAAYRTGVAETTLWQGSTWTKPRALGTPPTGIVHSLSCATPTFCEALSSGAAYRWNGVGWSQATVLEGAVAQSNPTYFTSVSCPSSSFCMAVDAGGNDVFFDGETWSAPAHFDNTSGGANQAGGGPSSVSCPSAKSCMVVDTDGYALRWNGASWLTPVDITPPSLVSVSCPTPRWCVAINQNSYASTWNGRGWSGPRFVDPQSMHLSQKASTTPVSWGQGDFGLLSVSCASRTFCAAIDDAGYMVIFDGRSWSTPVSFGPGLENGDMVTCTSPRFCLVASTAGNAIIGRG
jgi:hypothetical protein